MADKKITQLTDLGAALAGVDLFHVVDDPTGTPINKQVSAQNIFNNLPTYIGLKQDSQEITADGSSTTEPNVGALSAAITEINATTNAHSCDMSDGSDGQVKTIINTSTSGTNAITITPDSFDNTSITLNAPGETVTCLFKNSKWYVIAGNGYAIT